MSELMTQAVIGMSYEQMMSDDLSRLQFHRRAQSLLVENEGLRALIDVMHAGSLQHHAQIQALRGVVVEILNRFPPPDANLRARIMEALAETDIEYD